jgi:Zn-dependent protease with chaperone function
VILVLGSLAAVVLSFLIFPVGLIVTIPAVFFFLFLVKGFFKRSEKERTGMVEITEEDQPLLFDFIEKLCEEIGTPFPNRVYVSAEVNAAVLTPTSIVNLFWPGPKDLLIGLGLVNVLNLTEFKSVLAHEFGHFSQKSTRFDAYVVTANRIIGDLVYGRDWLDDLVSGWCRLDIRIAWIAWIIAGIMWVFRKILEGFFYLINLLRLSLSRQMEFNADLVAVSVAGSDAGVQALYRITFYDEVWGQAISDLRAAADHKLYTADLFYHLNHAANYLRKQKQEPRLGMPPALPDDPRDTPDLFKIDDEHVPEMWASHPSNFDREQNAKAYYIRSVIDERSAWVLFKEPEKLREEVTYRYYRMYSVIKKGQELADPHAVQGFIDDEHAETNYDPRYHGVYDERALEIEDVAELIEEAKKAGWNEGRLERVALKLYDAELKEWAEAHKGRREEYRLLAGLASGDLELKGDDLEFRGRKYEVEDAKRLMKKVDKELEEDRQYLEALDRRAFLVFYQMAMQVDDQLTAEMANRYEFHVTCQGMFRKLTTERTHLESVLAFLQGRRELQSQDFRAALKAFRDAHKALRISLATADELPLPALKNMKKGKPLGTFLLDKKLVHSLDRHEQSLRGDWINKFMTQLTEVIEKLRRIHFKSLGGILLLQDRIYQQWKEQLASMPVAQAHVEEPARPAPASATAAPRPVARPVSGPGTSVKPVPPSSRPPTPPQGS